MPVGLFIVALWLHQQGAILLSSAGIGSQLFPRGSDSAAWVTFASIWAMAGFWQLVAVMVVGQFPLFIAGHKPWVRWIALLARVPMILNMVAFFCIWVMIIVANSLRLGRLDPECIYPFIGFGAVLVTLIIQDWKLMCSRNKVISR